MAMTETSPQPPGRSDRPGRRRPFSTLMKKLANLKTGSGESGHTRKSTKKRPSKNNNPYPESGRIGPSRHYNSQPSLSTARSLRTASASSLSGRTSTEDEPPTTAEGARSVAPTVSTDHEAARSITAPSHRGSSLGGTSRTANGGVESRRGGDSTFSSPSPSVRSLTTTLTTIQSLAPNGGAQNSAAHSTHHGYHPQQSATIHFNQPFPTTSPALAIPSHLVPTAGQTGHPTTYATATANNLLTDNASILTLASSSKRRRRRSFDTDASVRALAPSSLFGGSRESLPLSVLSATIDGAGPTTPGLHRGASGMAAERTSIYSATGIMASERNSFYAKPGLGTGTGTGGDGASVRSGLLGHGRADSVTGSIGGLATSPLASPRDLLAERERSGVEEEDEDERCSEDNNGKEPGDEHENSAGQDIEEEEQNSHAGNTDRETAKKPEADREQKGGKE
ncbi:hypothetical protein GQ53DRAFT_753159 [Thozetella sp. PMI_491]|nr:hypothetical protein GQ53DRAFT_753159 [Thozetella sp. PMI_491]